MMIKWPVRNFIYSPTMYQPFSLLVIYRRSFTLVADKKACNCQQKKKKRIRLSELRAVTERKKMIKWSH